MENYKLLRYLVGVVLGGKIIYGKEIVYFIRVFYFSLFGKSC